jgi:hypothetical protein
MVRQILPTKLNVGSPQMKSEVTNEHQRTLFKRVKSALNRKKDPKLTTMLIPEEQSTESQFTTRNELETKQAVNSTLSHSADNSMVDSKSNKSKSKNDVSLAKIKYIEKSARRIQLMPSKSLNILPVLDGLKKVKE